MCNAFALSRRGFLSATALFGSAAAMGRMPASAQTAAPRPPAPATNGPAGALPARGEFLVKNAHVLTMDSTLGDISNGDIHVRDGVIVAVGPSLNAPGAETIDGKTMIALPGFIETHWHMWGTAARNTAGDEEATGYFPYSRVLGGLFSAEDNARGVRLGLAEAINGGLTTVNNWSHNLLGPEYADAELQAHKDFGGRALFSYGYSRKTGQNETLPLDDVARVRKEWLPQLDGRVTLGIASRGPENNTIDICRKEWETARSLDARITCHMGTSQKALETRHGVQGLSNAGLLGPDLVIVHNTHTTKEDLALIAKSGAFLSLSPFTEMRTGFGFPPILEMLGAGCNVSLSVDTALLCGNCDMFAIMKGMQNVGDAAKLSEFGLGARRVLEMATIDGARALGIEDKVGSLKPGKRADFMLVRTRDLNMAPMTDPVHMVVQSAQPSNVDTVFVDGRPLKRGGRLLAYNVDKIVDDANDTMDRVRAEVARQGRTAADVKDALSAQQK
jgi:cytosine/adenosine deaminase-related metal-dependent hydrolase